jgi:uncharacterized membrane protein SpoIIM required for sporulation
MALGSTAILGGGGGGNFCATDFRHSPHICTTMRETKFIEQNKEKWAEFEAQLREKQPAPDQLNKLFIQITDDLSYARTFYPNRSVRLYLNAMAQRIFHNVYRGKRFPAERLRLFWSAELPRLMWVSRRALLLSFCIFALAFAIGVVSSIINPDFARVILGDQYVEMTLKNIEQGDPMAVYKDAGPFGMTAGIAANNLFVALRTAIFGVLASIGTVFIMLYNGIMVGAFQYFFVEQGVFWESFLTIWIHGTLEISAIIIAGAAGLVAGSGLLFPGTFRRAQAFQVSMRQGLKIFIGIVPIIVLAAFFEGFFTRFTDTPAPVRAAFILVSLAFVLWYFVWLPWRLYRHTGDGLQDLKDKELPPDRAQAIDFESIKNAGGVLADTFTALFRHPVTTLSGVLGATALFAVFAFRGQEGSAAELFFFEDSPLGVLRGCAAFFDFEGAPLRYMAQVLLLTALNVAAFRSLEQEMPSDFRPMHPRWRMWLAALPMSLLIPGFIVFVRAESGVAAWLFGMAGLPLLALVSAVLYFETLNPLQALWRSFSLVRWGPLLLLGLLTVNLGLLFFLFLDSPIWSMTLQLFSWLVPPGEGYMRSFSTVATTCAASAMLYLFFLLLTLGGGLQYFVFREIRDAASLQAGIQNVGQHREIRGLAKES